MYKKAWFKTILIVINSLIALSYLIIGWGVFIFIIPIGIVDILYISNHGKDEGLNKSTNKPMEILKLFIIALLAFIVIFSIIFLRAAGNQP
jgi:predicted secreted protein